MLKEIVQVLVKDPAAAHRLKNGQFELAGVSEVEQRALLAALGTEMDLARMYNSEPGIRSKRKRRSNLQDSTNSLNPIHFGLRLFA